jgi:hypothetical protein
MFIRRGKLGFLPTLKGLYVKKYNIKSLQDFEPPSPFSYKHAIPSELVGNQLILFRN